MSVSLRIYFRGKRYELISVGGFFNPFRAYPSIYRHPFWSFRWAWVTITFNCFNRILPK